MALPSAQLGQMPTMQMPFYIPTQHYQKEPKAWEKALLSILTSAGGAVLGQGIQNSMQPDYAPQPATGFSKFWNGPTIPAARATELERQSMEQGKMEETARQNRLDRMLKGTEMNQAQTFRERQLQADIGKQISDVQHQTSADELANQQATTAATADEVRNLLAQIAATKQGKLVDVQIPDIKSQTRSRNAQSAKAEQEVEMMKRYGGGQQPGQPGAVNPNIAAFARSNSAMNPTPQSAPDPLLDPLIEMLRKQVAPPQAPAGGFSFPSQRVDPAAVQEKLRQLLSSTPSF